MIANDLFGEFVVYSFFGFIVALGLLSIGELTRLIWHWIDDYDSKIDNFACVVILRLQGYHKRLDGKYVHNTLNAEADQFYAGLVLVILSILTGIGCYLYQYYPTFAVILMVIVGVLGLTKYVRRLHKKIDNHITTHK